MEGVLLPLRGIRLKSFGNLNKPEGDSDIDPLWSPTMTPQQGRFPDASKDLPADLPFSPYSASLFSSATQATGLPGFGTTDQIDNHRDFVADLTRDDFFDYRSSPYLPPSPNSPPASQKYPSPFSEPDSLQDNSPLSTQPTITPPELFSLDMEYIEDDVLIKDYNDLPHSNDSVICDNSGLEVPPIMVTPCEGDDVAHSQPSSSNRLPLSMHSSIKTRRPRYKADRIANQHSIVNTRELSVASRRGVSAMRTTLPDIFKDLPEVGKGSKGVPAEEVSFVTSFSKTEARQSSEGSDNEVSHPSASVVLSNTSQLPTSACPSPSGSAPKSPLSGLSTSFLDLTVSEASSINTLNSQLHSAPLNPSELSSPRQNSLTLLPTVPVGSPGEKTGTVFPVSRVKKRCWSSAISGGSSSAIPVPTPYLFRNSPPTPSPTAVSPAVDHALSEDEHDNSAPPTHRADSRRGKRKSARKTSVSVKAEDTDDDNFVPFKRQAKRPRKASPIYSRRRCKTRPSTAKRVYKIPVYDKSTGWQALKMADGRFACNKCGIGFSRKHDLSRHWHASCVKRPDRESKLTCHLCGKDESRKDALDRHLKTVHKH